MTKLIIVILLLSAGCATVKEPQVWYLCPKGYTDINKDCVRIE